MKYIPLLLTLLITPVQATTISLKPEINTPHAITKCIAGHVFLFVYDFGGAHSRPRINTIQIYHHGTKATNKHEPSAFELPQPMLCTEENKYKS